MPFPDVVGELRRRGKLKAANRELRDVRDEMRDQLVAAGVDPQRAARVAAEGADVVLFAVLWRDMLQDLLGHRASVLGTLEEDSLEPDGLGRVSRALRRRLESIMRIPG